jgi:hypothetical protein
VLKLNGFAVDITEIIEWVPSAKWLELGLAHSPGT